MADTPVAVKDEMHVFNFNPAKAPDQAELGLTVYSNAGPITVLAGDANKPTLYTFTADPFFRRKDNYIASGAVSCTLTKKDLDKATLFLVAFNNCYSPKEQPKPPFSPHFRIQLASLRPEPPVLLVDLEGDLPYGQPRNFQLLAKWEKL